jgi:hypothetical protein
MGLRGYASRRVHLPTELAIVRSILRNPAVQEDGREYIYWRDRERQLVEWQRRLDAEPDTG